MKITARDILGESSAGSPLRGQGGEAFSLALNSALSGDLTSFAQMPALDRQGVDFLVKVVRSAMAQAQGGPFSLPGHVPMGMAHRPPHPALAGERETITPLAANDPGLVSRERFAHGVVPRPEDLAQGAASPRGAAPFGDLIQRAAATHGVDPDLVRAVVQTESSFNPRAVSPAGAQGLMQLMPATARELGVTDPFNAEQNVMAGTKYLKQLMERYHGRKELALAAYNWGMGNLERRPQEMPAETRNYVTKVLGLMDQAERGSALA